MIVISAPNHYKDEIELIHSFFEEGLELFHVRKPEFSERDMGNFLTEIGSEFKNRLVLHQHHHLTETFGINRIHFTSNNSLSDWSRPEISKFKTKKIKSTSVHNINYFNDLSLKSTHNFDYSFLSPVYPSISKPGYFSNNNLIESVSQRKNFSTKLIALGGITSENIKQALENGFDDVALLGTIWNSNSPIENFKKCQEIVLSYLL